MAVSAGTLLGPYQVLSRIGAGGMGEVYRARDPRLGREVGSRARLALPAHQRLGFRTHLAPGGSR